MIKQADRYISKFAFHVNKPKAKMLAAAFGKGCHNLHYDCIITDRHTPLQDRVGVFYGVVPETYAAYRFYAAEGRAVVFDNGWLSSPKHPTFRFSWNSIQPFLQDMPTDPRWSGFSDQLPAIVHKPIPNRALLILQSRQYFDFMRLGYTRDQWERVTTKILEGKGYEVERREKPTKKGPEADTFFDQMARASIVVSLNSAATVKALRYGIPAFCTLDCTPSPLAPVRIPDAGKAAPPDPRAVKDMCDRMWSYEIGKPEFMDGRAIETILSVAPEHRRGYTYGQ